jgi:hypothetical protein
LQHQYAPWQHLKGTLVQSRRRRVPFLWSKLSDDAKHAVNQGRRSDSHFVGALKLAADFQISSCSVFNTEEKIEGVQLGFVKPDECEENQMNC